MKYYKIPLVLLICLGFLNSIRAQRFSLLVEAGPLRGQVDGDKLQGFFYNGFSAGIGSNVTLEKEHFASIKTSYYAQGSKLQDLSQRGVNQSLQLSTDLQTIGLELSYKYKPVNEIYFVGLGFVRHQLVKLEYEVHSKPLLPGDPERILDPGQLKSGFTSLKIYAGFRAFPKGEIYFALESSLTNLLNSDFFEVKSLVPYSISAVFTYEIIAPEEVRVRKRPGSKVRQPRRS